MKRLITIIILSLLLGSVFALDISLAEPPNWWSGMEHDSLKILLTGDDFSGWEAAVKSKNVKLIDQGPYDDKHYYKVVLKVKKSGDFYISFTHPDKQESVEFPYSIFERQPYRIREIDANDVVYLLMPDRFADGDKDSNDIPGHHDPIRPEHKWGRKGGDLRGVIDHLDYLEELGITALWMTPVYENDYINCYHGYTPTNSYRVDPYLGDLDVYHELVNDCHERGISVIQDHIVNHVSPTHPLAVHPPSKGWINGNIEDHENCNYQIKDITDVYGPASQRQLPIEGWFAGYLADMNMANPDVVDYFIHHAIWWIETMHLDGIREDTYAYSDLDGLSRWAKELKREYPDLYIVGEIMDFDRTRLSYYFNDGIQNYLTSIADFGFSSELYQLIVENKPLLEFYGEIANDFIYRAPNKMLTFLDNHDIGRFYSALEGDPAKYLNALTLLFSMRGIPQLYYGNEIGMPGGPDPDNRNAFPGGFNESDHNAFIPEGRTTGEGLIFEQVKQFTNLRKAHPELFRSAMQHDLQDDVYLVSRSCDKSEEAVLVAYNQSNKTQKADFGRIVNGKWEKATLVKKPQKGNVKFDLEKRTIIVPAGETVMLLLE